MRPQTVFIRFVLNKTNIFQALYNGMPSRLYELNHPYALARALKAAVDRAVRDGDGEVLANVSAVILQKKNNNR